MIVFSAQLAEDGMGFNAIVPFHFVYPLNSSYVVPSTPSPARLARYAVAICTQINRRSHLLSDLDKYLKTT